MKTRPTILLRACVASAVALTAAACGLTDPDSRLEDLQAQHAAWNDLRPASYLYELHRTCPCPDEVKRPTRIQVGGSDVLEVRDAETDEVLPASGERAVTVDDIFAHLIEHARQRNTNMSVRFDSTYNYPIEAHGWVGGAVGEEFLYRIVEFVPDP